MCLFITNIYLFANVSYVNHYKMYKLAFILATNYVSFIWTEWSHGKKKQRSMASHSKHPPVNPVEQKKKGKKKFLGDHVRGKIIDRIDHQTIIRKVETDL